jgi:hypothetical protein
MLRKPFVACGCRLTAHRQRPSQRARAADIE